MAVLRRFNLVGTPQSSAGTARERLLHDCQMRCSQETPARCSPASTLSSPGIFRQALSPYQLSSAEQQRQAIQIARTFNHHYLATIHHESEDRGVIAVVRPIPGRTHRREVAHEIYVDAVGNVNVAPCSADPALGRRGILVRTLMTAGVAVLILAGSLLIL